VNIHGKTNLWKNNYSSFFLVCLCYYQTRSKIRSNKGSSMGLIIFNQGL